MSSSQGFQPQIPCGLVFFVIKSGGISTIILAKHLTAFGYVAAAIQQENYLQIIDWQKIVKKHGPAVWQTVYRLLGNDADAADCFQETFIVALEVARRQRVRNFSALLVRLATARAIDRLRRRYAGSKHSAAKLATVPDDNLGPLEQTQAHELGEKLKRALMQLPAQEAQVFCLRHLNDMGYRRIAKELGIKTNAAGVLLHRAKTKLRGLLQEAVRKEQV